MKTILQKDRHPAEPPTKPPANTLRPRGVEARRLNCAPGTSRSVLDELAADTAPTPPTQRELRAAFNRPVQTWLPNVGLRAVPVASVPRDDIETTAADVARLLGNYTTIGAESPVGMILAPLVAMLSEVA